MLPLLFEIVGFVFWPVDDQWYFVECVFEGACEELDGDALHLFMKDLRSLFVEVGRAARARHAHPVVPAGDVSQLLAASDDI